MVAINHQAAVIQQGDAVDNGRQRNQALINIYRISYINISEQIRSLDERLTAFEQKTLASTRASLDIKSSMQVNLFYMYIHSYFAII